ncbi:MAG: matrixin family metalloprotease, partial [Planctomycetes bacterium]|nr:matrixin family metalloprotease [Planctomycetota bacterium]
MRSSFRVAAVATLCVVAIAVGVGTRWTRGSDLDAEYEKVKDVVSREDFGEMQAVHRKILAHIVETNVKAQRPVVAACWDGAAGNQATIDAFNAAITLGLSTGQEFQQTGRWSSGSMITGSTAQGEPVTLRYSFVPDGTTIPDGVGEGSGTSSLFSWLNGLYGSPAVWQQIFHDEFQRWSDLTGVSYVYEPNDDGSVMFSNAGAIGVRGDVRIGAKAIDGNSGILAYNFFPNNGDMVLEANDSFYATTTNNSRRLRNVISHEHGHGLGMLHVCPVAQTKLMEPYAATNFLGPQEDDILNGQRHYGDIYEPNDSSAAAADLGALGNGLHSFDLMSTDDNGDTDYYRFTTAAAHDLTVTLRPVGSSYLQGTQTSACDTGTNYNALNQSDLSLAVIDGNGSTVLASANLTGLGQSEQIFGLALATPGNYYIRVTPDSSNTIQAYELDIQLQAYVPPSFSIALPEGTPATVVPDYRHPVRVVTTNGLGSPDPAGGILRVSVNGGAYSSIPMVYLGSDVWLANLPPLPVGAGIDWYLQMSPLGGGANMFAPAGAPAQTFHATADASAMIDVVVEDFQTGAGWTVSNDAALTAGAWERAVPNGGGGRGDPVSDADGSGFCYVTENGAGNTDVDGGTTYLISPVFDLSGYADPHVGYQFWYTNDFGSSPNSDVFQVFFSDNGGSSWTAVETYNGNAYAWLSRSFRVSDYVNLTSNFRVRFAASEPAPTGRVVAAGLADFRISVADPSAGVPPCAAGTRGLRHGP